MSASDRQDRQTRAPEAADGRTDSTGSNGVQITAAAEARRLIRAAVKGALATLDRGSGHPSASLITLATLPGNQPVFLISRLAQHTRNLEADGRASILFDGTGAGGDPLTGGRLSVIGRAVPASDPAAARARFLARHPDAALYADFADFAFYALDIERAHYVGGFGRIAGITAAELRCDTSAAADLLAAESDIITHMNADHATALSLYATALAGAEAGPWQMTGIDPDGCDLVHDGAGLRIDFPRRINTPAEARAVLAELARAARAAAAGR